MQLGIGRIRPGRLLLIKFLAAFLIASEIGCAYTWNKMTSRRFRKEPRTTLFVTPDPMVVMRNPDKYDADTTREAMLNLTEKKIVALSEQDRQDLIAILEPMAIKDPAYLMRWDAMKTLARIKDPRCAEIIENAYQTLVHLPPPTTYVQPATAMASEYNMNSRGPLLLQGGFTVEQVTDLETCALDAMGKVLSPQGLNTLCQVAKKPTATRSLENLTQAAVTSISTVDDLQLKRTAIRALSNYKNEAKAVKTLIELLQSETDVAVAFLSYESLEKITGVKLNRDPTAWYDYGMQNLPPDQKLTVPMATPEVLKNGSAAKSTPDNPTNPSANNKNSVSNNLTLTGSIMNNPADSNNGSSGTINPTAPLNPNMLQRK